MNRVKALVAAGANLNGTSDRGQSPLILASLGGHYDVVKLLLDAGADANLKDSLGLSALDWATRRGFSEVVQIISISAPGCHLTVDSLPEENSELPHASTASVGATATGAGRIPTRDIERPTPRLGNAASAILRTVAAEVDHEMNGGPHNNEMPTQVESLIPSTPIADTRVVATDKVETEESPDDILVLPPIEYLNPDQVIASADDSDPAQDFESLASDVSIDDLTLEATSTIDPSVSTLVPRQVEEPEVTMISTGEIDQLPEPRGEEPDATRPGAEALPSFLPAPDQAPAKSMLWLWILVLLTLIASGFVGYRWSNFFYRTEKALPGPVAVAAKSELPAPASPIKTGPKIAGALSGAELFVPDAEYPAQASGASGPVNVEIQVNQRGMVVSAHAVDGDQNLRAAAVKAAKSAAFSPEKIAGKGRSIAGTITYSFSPQAGSSADLLTSPSTAAADSDAPVSGGPLEGTERNLLKAQYPASAKSRGVTGDITVVVRVNRAGNVISWRTLDGDTQLRAAALAAAKRSTFDSTKLPGTGEVVGTITYHFK